MKTLRTNLWSRDSIKWPLVAFVVFAAFTCVLLVSRSASAQQSELTQQIKPIECIFTTIQTGDGGYVDSTCDNQPIPFVTSVDTNAGRPLLRGSFDSMRSTALRIWIGGRWYVSGLDARLTTNANLWTLDLTSISLSLVAGVYTVVVEVETFDGLVLRNEGAATFEVFQNTGVFDAPPLPSGRSSLVSPFFSTATVPSHTQIDGRQLDSVNSFSPAEKIHEAGVKTDSSRAVASVDIGALFIITALNILAVGVILYTYLRYKR